MDCCLVGCKGSIMRIQIVPHLYIFNFANRSPVNSVLHAEFVVERQKQLIAVHLKRKYYLPQKYNYLFIMGGY